MCTLTYFPLTDNQFIWTHNRDEDPSRSVPGLIKDQNQEKTMYYPKDKRSGGTWIAADQNRIVSLLNGAFVAHPYQLSSVKSRGLVVLESMQMDIHDFFDSYVLEGIEPFTMIIWDHGLLYDFRWDKEKRTIEQLDHQKRQIWSSVTLYNPDQRQQRKQLFEQYFTNQAISTTQINRFHRLTGDQESEAISIDREYVKTVSISQLSRNEEQIIFEHEDRLSGQLDRQVIDLK